MKQYAVALTIFAFSVGLSRAGAFDPARVPAEAKWLAHIDAQRLRETRLGTLLMEQLRTEETDRKFAGFAAVFGFDPREDLQSITVFGRDQNEENSAMLLKGTLNTDQLVTLVKAGDDYQSATYGGTEIHGWSEFKKGRNQRSHGAIAADGTVIISRSENMVRAALDVLRGNESSLSGNQSFGDLAVLCDGDFIVAVADLSQMDPTQPQAAVFKKANWGRLVVGESDNQVSGSLTLGAASVETAQQIQAIAMGMVAMGLFGREQNPALADLARACSVQCVGNAVTLTLACPAEKAMAFLMHEMEKKRAATEQFDTTQP